MLGDKIPIIDSPPVLGKIKHFLTRSFIRHLGHTEVRGEKNNRTQNSTALRGKDDKIMALRRVTDTEVSFHLRESAPGRFSGPLPSLPLRPRVFLT